MNMYADSTVKLDAAIITKFYTEKAGTKFAPVLHNLDMSADWEITPELLCTWVRMRISVLLCTLIILVIRSSRMPISHM